MSSRPDEAGARGGRRTRRLGGLGGLLLVPALLLLGCATSVHLTTLPARPNLHHEEVSSETPYQIGADSARILAAADPHWQSLTLPRRLAAVLNSPRLATSDRLYAGAETALTVASQLESQGDASALDHYVLAAALAHDLLVQGAFPGGGDVRRANAAAFFNVAAGKAALALLAEDAALDQEMSAGGRRFALALGGAGRGGACVPPGAGAGGARDEGVLRPLRAGSRLRGEGIAPSLPPGRHRRAVDRLP